MVLLIFLQEIHRKKSKNIRILSLLIISHDATIVTDNSKLILVLIFISRMFKTKMLTCWILAIICTMFILNQNGNLAGAGKCDLIPCFVNCSTKRPYRTRSLGIYIGGICENDTCQCYNCPFRGNLSCQKIN